MGLASLAMCLSLAVIWLTGVVSLRFFLNEVETRSLATLEVQSAVLEKLLDKFRLMAPLMARSPDVYQTLVTKDPILGRQVAAIAAGMGGAQEVWFLDDAGKLVASSLENAKERTEPDLHAVPTAFRQAVQGQLGRELLIGSPVNTSSYVFASGVRSGNRFAGALAIKVDLQDVEQAWALSKDPIVAMEEGGRVAVTNVRDWRGLVYSSVQNEKVLTSDPGLLGLTAALPGVTGAPKYLDLPSRLQALGWDVHVLADIGEARQQSGRAMIIALLLCVILWGLLGIAIYRRDELSRRFRRDRIEAVRLERRVRSRTAELRKANTLLEQEVRDRLQAEEDLRRTQAELVQAAKLATLGQMSAALSHEYNQPLAAIRSDAEIADMLIERGRAEEARSNLSKIQKMVARMAEIARTLKGFTRKSGTGVNPVSLNQVIDEALLMVRPQLKQRDILLETDLPEGAVIVKGGRIRLEQVLVNLLSNASDALMDVGKPRIDLGLSRHEGMAILTVADNGSGLDPEVLPHVFDPFFTTKDVGEGLGLGLSITYKIIHDFGGSITVRNRETGGAEFVIQLPLADSETLAAE